MMIQIAHNVRAVAARELRRVRAEALPKTKAGLLARYRSLELPGANPLKDAHAALDAAVTAPGVPRNYPDPAKLVTPDCIWPG